MATVREIVNVIGRDALADALGLANAKSIQPAVTAGEFPAAWYPTIKELCEKQEISIPMALFNWKIPVSDNHTTA